MVSSSRISLSLQLELLMLISLCCPSVVDSAATPLPKPTPLELQSRIDPFHQYDDLDLYARFRFSVELLRITGLLDHDLQHNTNQNLSPSPAMQVC